MNNSKKKYYQLKQSLEGCLGSDEDCYIYSENMKVMAQQFPWEYNEFLLCNKHFIVARVSFCLSSYSL